ncbi:hypothetical protein PhCBS80983_g01189 [Powellomyces hirtus]|uniref:Piwi domain-containing protein n=1 Tax=Powellomyces hirtus TaxID=109895 RepID=A0A507EC12_9FUNG|nr:hypothetical protein PhCBS80983_g01189 [Powellomyces hirtus]
MSRPESPTSAGRGIPPPGGPPPWQRAGSAGPVQAQSNRNTPVPSASADTGNAIVKRPGVGTKGIPFQVTANFYQMTTIPDATFYHWEVGVTTQKGHEVKDLTTCRKALEVYSKMPTSPLYQQTFMENTFCIPPSASAGKGSRRRWNGKTAALKQGMAKGKSLVVELQHVADIDMAELGKAIKGEVLEVPQKCIQLLNIVLGHHPSASHFTVGQAFYPINDPQSTFNLANSHVNLHVGYRTSVRTSRGKVMLNVDVANTLVLKPGPLLDIMARVANLRLDQNTTLNPIQRGVITSSLLGVKVSSATTEPSGPNGVPPLKQDGEIKLWSWKIWGFSKDSVTKTTFTDADGKTMTVAKYFELKYGVRVRFPNLPCFNSDRSKTEPKWIPMEFAIVDPKQLYRKTLDGNMSRQMIDITCQPPSIRERKIQDAFNRIQSPASIMDAFNLKIGGGMMKVDARMLPAPRLKYGANSRGPEIQPRDGAWNLRDKTMLVGMELRNWAVVCFGDQQRTFPPMAVQKFVTQMVSTCNNTGMRITMARPNLVWEAGAIRDQDCIAGVLEKIVKGPAGRPQLIMCLLPTPNKDAIYNAIKHYADTIAGIPTQCVADKHIAKASPQYCANVCMKINMKLGGITSELSTKLTWVSSKPTMIIGIDVTHPTFGDKTMPSIAAVVGTINAGCSQYYSSLRIQDARMETLTEGSVQFAECLRAFIAKNKIGPARILVYRDGVSEGEFDSISKTEINAIRAAAERVKAGYRPAITYVACQKRHNARFFPIVGPGAGGGGRGGFSGRGGRGGGGAGRGGGSGGGGVSYPYDNVPPGTVIDTGVTHPTLHDYFMVSHAGLKGTSRPVHYQVLRDENRINQDDLQALTYELCHLYGKATRAVSVVTPVYYAHIVAARARCWFSAMKNAQSINYSPSGSSESLGLGQGGGRLPKLHSDLEGSLWYM